MDIECKEHVCQVSRRCSFHLRFSILSNEESLAEPTRLVESCKPPAKHQMIIAAALETSSQSQLSAHTTHNAASTALSRAAPRSSPNPTAMPAPVPHSALRLDRSTSSTRKRPHQTRCAMENADERVVAREPDPTAQGRRGPA